MIDGAKIEKLIALLAIGFSWAQKTGEWRIENKEKIPIKSHGRPSKSIFRYGLDWIFQSIMKLVYGRKQLINCIKLLIPKSYKSKTVVPGGLI